MPTPETHPQFPAHEDLPPPSPFLMGKGGKGMPQAAPRIRAVLAAVPATKTTGEGSALMVDFPHPDVMPTKKVAEMLVRDCMQWGAVQVHVPEEQWEDLLWVLTGVSTPRRTKFSLEVENAGEGRDGIMTLRKF